MELNLKVVKAEGEITYLFSAISLSFFIVLYVCFMVMTTNNFNIEYYVREIANRVTAKSLIKNIENLNQIELEIKKEKKRILSENNSNILFDVMKGLNIEELKEAESKNRKVFKLFFDKNEPYKIGGIINYKIKALAYIFITLNEE